MAPKRTGHVVGSVEEFPIGNHKVVKIGNREIGIFNIKGEYFALANKCPHEGASLCKGRMVGLAQSDEPGRYRLVRQGEMSSALGTAGNSTSAPDNLGAIRKTPMCGNTRYL